MASLSSLPNRRRRKTSIAVAADLYLPVECWEYIINFLKDDNRCLKSLSLISKQFHTITNNLRFSLTICDQTLPFLHLLYRRFINLTSLNFSHLTNSSVTNLNRLLRQISCFPLKLTSLNLSNKLRIPANGLRHFSKKITTLTSLTCSNMGFISITDIFLISECFPLLEFLDLSDPHHREEYEETETEHLSFTFFKLRKANEEREESYITSQFIASLVSLKYLTCLDLLSSNISDELLSSIAIEGLPLTRLCLQNCKGYSYSGIFDLLSKCRYIQHLDLQRALFLTDKHVVELSLFLGDLVSINLTHCLMLTVSAFFALIKSCPSLSDIKMENTSIGKKSLEGSKSWLNFTVHPQLKYLCLAWNPWLTDENIKLFASIFPNLQLLDLSGCYDRFEEGIVQVLRLCCNIRNLNLSYTNVDDETLYVISKSCRGFLQLSLKGCTDVTKKGMEHVVENCRQLKLIK
ncbi:unnamed protein product [Trifolium pratense]|uniref:Uncharacterized protein n=1 Tax=Trifolium pratense TaxID=57577 RepID=A0ACB0J2U6_TRIPR|nr:unnamed protein product [Trifolium pratense]